MKKYDIAEIFTDIDDEFIANAKPVAQKPLELRPVQRSKSLVWKKCAAAAACLAVIAAAGSVIAVKVGDHGQIAGPGSSGESVLSNESLSTEDPLEQTDNTAKLPTVGLDSDWYRENHNTDSWHNDSEIYFYGVNYKVLNSKEFDGVKLLVGSDQVKDMIEFVAAVENTTDKPIMLYVPYSRDNDSCSNIIGTHKEIAVNIEKDGVKLCDADADEDHLTDDQYLLVVQPGETYYQRMRFDTYHGRYCEIGTEYTPVPDGIYNGTATVSLVSEAGGISVRSLDFDLNVTRYTYTEPEKKWTNGSEFTYEGKTYKVFSIQGGGGFSGDGEGNFALGHWTNFVVGVRRDSADVIEFVAFIENSGNEPRGILSTASSPEAPILFQFDTDVNKDTHNIFTNEEFKYMPYILQPGETYYQKAVYNITEEEYLLAVCYGLCDPDRFDGPMMYRDVPSYGGTYNWADFADKSVDDDDVYKLFGSSKLSKELAAAAKRDKSFGGYDNDSGFSN